MNDSLQRDTLIDLLSKLGSERDEDALAAARALHAQVSDSGLSWQDLLADDETTVPAAVPEEENNAPEPAAAYTGDDSETSQLIDRLLARDGNSEEFRQELEEYKTDLANGDFEPSDHRYVHALYARLMKNG